MPKTNYNIQKHSSEDFTFNNNNIFVSGIYNYCDRWCERCKFTKRCSVYAIEKANDLKSDANNIGRVSNIFAITMDMLHNMAEEFGINLDEITDMEIPEHIPSEIEELAINYSSEVHKWLIENNDFFVQQMEMYLAINNKVGKSIEEVLQVIDWYSNIIGSKIHRAMYSEAEESIAVLNDQLGSAKVAHISIERSIGAMSFILDNIPEKEKESLNFLTTLTKIKTLLNKSFPNAMMFQRPGLDD